MKKLIFAFLLVIVVVGGGTGYLLLTDRTKPEVTLSPAGDMAAPKREFTLGLRDTGSELKSAKVVVSQGDKQITLLDKSYPSPVSETTEKFSLEPAGLRDGPFTLSVTVTDRSIANFGAGNATALKKNLTSQGFFVVDPGLRSDKFKNISDFFRKVKEDGSPVRIDYKDVGTDKVIENVFYRAESTKFGKISSLK